MRRYFVWYETTSSYTQMWAVFENLENGATRRASPFFQTEKEAARFMKQLMR